MRQNGSGWARVGMVGLAIACATTARTRAADIPLPPVVPGAARQVPQGSPIPRIQPVPLPGVTPPAPSLPPPAPPSGAAAEQKVTVSSVALEGVTAYPKNEIAALTKGLAGNTVTLAQIDLARQAIVRYYRTDGYVLATVDVSVDAKKGLVRFRVTEGRIASVKLSGDIGPAGVQVLRFLNHLTERQPINSATLERYLLLAQDVPGVSVRAVLQPAPDDPGAVDLVAVVTRQKVSGLATVDNRAWKETGPIESLAAVDFNSFTAYGERTELSLYHSWNNTQIFGQAAAEVFLGGSGLKLRVYAGAGDAVPTGDLRLVGYDSQTTVFGVQLSYPVIRARQQTLNVYASFDGIDSQINENTVIGQPASYDSLRILRAGSDYILSDIWAGGSRPATNQLSGRISQGLSILGASANLSNPPPEGATNPGRFGERIDFFKFNFDFSRTQTLFTPWEGASVALQGILAGQVSPDVLPPEEQYYLGGSRLNRGYYAGQVTGDNALAATAELQLNTPIGLGWLGLSKVTQNVDVNTQLYAFYDWGETWQNQKSDPNRRLASLGGGARVYITRYTEFDFEGVSRLTLFPNGTGGPGAPVKGLPNGGFYWRILARF